MMIDVIEKTFGHTNYEMWQKCEMIRSVVFATIDKEEGRGKKKRIVKTFKHNTPKGTMDIIANSCNHYKKLYEMEIGSLEIVKYRFEKINGEPKIIIDMVKVLDKNGQYIKFAKLEGVTNFLSKYPVKFKDSDSV
jgi:hypothetical protein